MRRSEPHVQLPQLQILFKWWASEEANYWMGSMLLFWIPPSALDVCWGSQGVAVVLVRGRERDGGGLEGSEQPACNTWEAPCLHYQWHQTWKRKGGLCVPVMRTAVCWNRLRHHTATHNHTISHTEVLFSSFSHSYINAATRNVTQV